MFLLIGRLIKGNIFANISSRIFGRGNNFIMKSGIYIIQTLWYIHSVYKMHHMFVLYLIVLKIQFAIGKLVILTYKIHVTAIRC